MKVLDDDGQELAVTERMAEPVRWLVTEAAQVVQDSQCSWKIIINLGQGMLRPKRSWSGIKCCRPNMSAVDRRWPPKSRPVSFSTISIFW